ncbi:molybdopterin-guanine dinucleotide biosynthesis protein B [Salinarimonas rosea]|uniref:molybdopterin-guanine dinucleotide biosynthesis protein B n=1 Tax=Salinarimonas rosea TaxID=552063 RepID=UPI0003FA45A4|nr:molybdopterin-guanine dinucleotide biosynthesis protein B [Salinarimonas rosea]
MRVIGLAGWSGAGKTTLLAKLIPALVARGVEVSTVKHAHHAFDIDRPGKDSHTHRAAGAREVLVASGRRFALMREYAPGEEEPPLGALLARLAPVDLVVVEGFKAWGHPKIEVFRAANGKPHLYGQAPAVRAIASDVALADAPVPVVPLDDVEAIADIALREAVDRDALCVALAEVPPPARLKPARG